MNKILEKIFGYRGYRIIIPLIDLAVIYGSYILAFYLFKDALDNFTLNYNAFKASIPFIIIRSKQ